MSTYDFHLFAVERYDDGYWVTVPAAGVTYEASYDPDANGTLIIGSESIHITRHIHGDTAAALDALDLVRISYNGAVIGVFTVDTVQNTVTVDPTASDYGGQTVTTACSVSAVGAYAAAQATIVSWLTPISWSPNPLATIQRWVNVDNWPE